MKRVPGIILLCIAAICLTTAAMMAGRDAATNQAYRQLSLSTVRDADGSRDDTEPSWEELRNQNGELVGWLYVEGTPIDYPIVQPQGETPVDFYLDHDFWRKPNLSGCPYLDNRTYADATHILVFGHELGLSDQMFSTLRQTWSDEVFRKIGMARWSTPKGTETFQPLCALKVKEHFELIQSFSFDGQASLHDWLREITRRAATVAEGSEALISQTTRVLTLVTCASPVPETEERTLMLFTSTEQQED